MRHGGGRRTKNLQGEREKEEKGGKKEERGERKEMRKGKKGEMSKRFIRPMGVKHPLRIVNKDYKIHEKRGGEKSRKRGRRDIKSQRKHGDRGQIEM